MIHLEDYKPEHKDGIIKLLGNREYKKKIWDWQYFMNPYAAEALRMAVILDDDKVVGYCAAMPVKIKFKQKLMMSHWIVDLYVHMLYRGKNVGRRIYQLQKEYPLLLTYGISDMAAPIVRKLGWKVNYEIEEYYLQNRINDLKSLIKIGIQKISRMGKPKTHAADSSLTAAVVPVGEILGLIDSIWNPCQNAYPSVIIRNADYIAWKYSKHPLATYRAILVKKEDKPVAIGIFRANKNRARLVDYIGPYRDNEIKSKIIETFIAECHASAQLNCISTDSELNSCLKAYGFLKYKRRPRFYVFSKQIKSEEIERDWFIMAGDADDDLLEAAKDYYALGADSR